MKANLQTAIPVGMNTGVIAAARETTKDFGKTDENNKRVLEPVVEIVIRPDYREEGKQTLDVSCLFAASLNGLSGLSAFLNRLGVDVPNGAEWKPASLVGTRVRFSAKKNRAGFIAIEKETLGPAV